MADLISLCSYRSRLAVERAWSLAWAALELRETALMIANVRSCLALAETDSERDRHLRKLVQLHCLRGRYEAEERKLRGGSR